MKKFFTALLIINLVWASENAHKPIYKKTFETLKLKAGEDVSKAVSTYLGPVKE
jgi:hypothetical protein